MATADEATPRDRIEALLGAEEEPEATPQGAEAEEETDTEVSESQETTQDDTQEASQDDADEQTEAPQVELSDIAQVLGVEEDALDVNDDGELIFKTKVDGEERPAKATDLLKGYQLEGHLNKQNMEVVEQKKALEQERQQFQQERDQKLQEAEQWFQLAAQELQQEFQNVDWDSLRQEDPQEYTLKRQEFQDRQNRLQQGYQQLQQERQQKQLQTIQSERQKLLEKMPELSDSQTFQKTVNQISQGLKNAYGFSDQDIQSLVDHRFVVMARDALKYQQLQQEKPQKTKRVKAAPKVAKPGQRKSDSEAKAKSVEKLKGRIKKTGGQRGDVANLLLESGKV